MLIRWGQISLLALLAVITLFIVGDVRDAASQESDDPKADPAADALPGDDAVAGEQAEVVDAIDVRCEVPGTSTILEIVADGTEVKAGDVLVRLDDILLQNDASAAEIAVAQAEARLRQSEAQLESVIVAADADRQALALRHEIAELELQRYRESSLPLQITESQSRIRLLESQVSVLTERVETLERFVSEQAAAPGDLESVRLELIEAEANLDLARLTLQNVREYDGPLQTKKLELQVVESESALYQVDRARRASRAQAEADVAAARIALQLAEQELSTARARLEQCLIRAPRDGVVIHPAVPGRRARGGLLQAGLTVREGQILLQIVTPE